MNGAVLFFDPIPISPRSMGPRPVQDITRCTGRGPMLLLVAALATVAIPAQSFAAEAQIAGNDFAKILALAGWDESAFARFQQDEFEQDEPLSEEETRQLLPLLKRLKSFDALSIARWTTADVSTSDILAKPSDFQSQLVHLQGTLLRVELQQLSEDDAERFELPSVSRCQVAINDDIIANVLVADVPKSWTSDTTNEPVSFAGLVIKRMPSEGDSSGLVFLAPRLAWHPTTTAGANHSFGRAVLGGLGFDVSLLDDIRNRGPIRSQEREAFYQMLSATNRIGSNQLIRSANRALAEVAAEWQAESNATTQRSLMAREVVRQAGEGRYSVAPLFNDSNNQIGNLVALEGVVRRAVKIDIDTLPNGRPSDVSRRFGIGHYFELDLFTADSQDYPIVFCTPELSADFPLGSKLHEPVQLAGFFFKSWRHHTRQTAGDDNRQQLAPLLLGPMPLRIETTAKPSSKLYSIGASAIFVLALAGVWLAARWTSRGDAKFQKRENVAVPDFSDWGT